MHDRRTFLTVAGASVGSLLSGSLIQAAAEPLRVLFYGGALPEFQKALEQDYAVKVLKAGVKTAKKGQKDDKEDNVEGLEQLDAADIWVGSAAKRNFPSKEQLGHFKKFLDAGKPFVGYRAASHIFQNWLEADQAVWGAKYGGHHLLNKDPVLIVKVAEGMQEHAILKGITPPAPRSGSYHYTQLAGDVKVLLYSGLNGDMQPHTWVRENAKTKGRAFYTRYDAKQIAAEPVVREIFLRGFLWALNRDMSKHRKSS